MRLAKHGLGNPGRWLRFRAGGFFEVLAEGVNMPFRLH